MPTLTDALHAQSPQFLPIATAAKLAVALAIGLLIGFKRQWSNKEFGVRTFSLAGLLGGLTALMPLPILLISLGGIIGLAILLNVRDIRVSGSMEGTTSIAVIGTRGRVPAVCGHRQRYFDRSSRIGRGSQFFDSQTLVGQKLGIYRIVGNVLI